MKSKHRKAYQIIGGTTLTAIVLGGVAAVIAYQNAVPKSEAEWWTAAIGKVPEGVADIHVYDKYLSDNPLATLFANLRPNSHGTTSTFSGILLDEKDNEIRYTTDGMAQVKEGRIFLDHKGIKVSSCWSRAAEGNRHWSLDFSKGGRSVSLGFSGVSSSLKPERIRIWNGADKQFSESIQGAVGKFQDELRKQPLNAKTQMFMAPCNISKGNAGVSFRILVDSDQNSLSGSDGSSQVVLEYQAEKTAAGGVRLRLQDSSCDGNAPALNFWEQAKKNNVAYAGKDFDAALQQVSAGISASVRQSNAKFYQPSFASAQLAK